MGYTLRKSTITCNVAFLSFISDGLDNGYHMDVILIEFSKVFDTSDRGLIIRELEFFDIGKPLLSWLNSYTTDSSHIIKVYNRTSKLVGISLGVFQGGHLSLLLFCLFVNSISNHIRKANFLLYVDDVKLFLRVKLLWITSYFRTSLIYLVIGS